MALDGAAQGDDGVGASGLAAISTTNTDQEIDDLGSAVEDSLHEMRLNDPWA